MSRSSVLFQNIGRKLKQADDCKDRNREQMLRADVRRYRRILAGQLPLDLPMPATIKTEVDHPVLLHCDECGRELRPWSVAEAADWIDEHAHCHAWLCSACDQWEYEFRDTCRFCNSARGELALSLVQQPVHQQLVRYAVRLGGVRVAYVEAPSLLRARRAALGMWPWILNDRLVVELPGAGRWQAKYGHRLE